MLMIASISCWTPPTNVERNAFANASNWMRESAREGDPRGKGGLRRCSLCLVVGRGVKN